MKVERTDVVVGAASGMGAAVARRLAPLGGRLLLADLDVDAIADVADELGERVEVHRCDLTDPDDVVGLASATEALGRLVITAGLSPTMAPGPRILDVNLVGPARMLDAFEPLAGAGSVAVVLASMAAFLAPTSEEIDRVLDEPTSPSLLDRLMAAGAEVDDAGTAYGLSKRGVVRLVRRAASPWGSRGARTVSVSPGIIDTPMGRREHDAQPVMADFIAGSPLGRMIGADEVAAVVEFLASPAASAVTGADLRVDGGALAALGL